MAEEPQSKGGSKKQPADAPKAKRPARSGAAASGGGSASRSAGAAPRARNRRQAGAEAASGADSGAERLAKPRLEQRYLDEIKGTLVREFGYSSAMQAPKPVKVVVNMGLGEALTNARALETAPEQLGVITGQRPVITKARRSVAGFKIREGMSIGCMVTLRGRRMYEFLDRLMNLALPRIRDFRGTPRAAFDGKGNYSMGLREQAIFPELEYGSIDRTRGMQVTITTTAESDREGFRLLELLGMPFAREGQGR